MRQILLDTPIIVDFLSAGNKQLSLMFLMASHYQFSVSSVTVNELRSGITEPQHNNDLDLILSGCEVLEFNDEIAEKAEHLERHFEGSARKISMRNLFIAATAMSNRLPLATVDKTPYKSIEGLQLLSV